MKSDKRVVIEAKAKIRERLRNKHEVAIESMALERFRDVEAMEQRLGTEAMLGRAVYELQCRVDELDPRKTKSQSPRRWLGRAALRRQTLLQQKIRRVTVPTTDRPDIWVETGERAIELPPDNKDFEPEHTFTERWVVGFPGSPRPANSSRCNIYRLHRDELSGEEERELYYYVWEQHHAIKGSEELQFHGSVFSYTDGKQDDELVTIGKNAAQHAASLISQVSEYLT